IGRPDILLHLAWDGLPNYQSSRHLETELPIQVAFLDGLIEAGLPSLLVTGTCYEYGLLEGELVEGAAGSLTNVYARAKVALYEKLCRMKEAHPFALIWARLFYLWGPGQAAGSLFSQLKAAAERGDERFPMSKGEQLRDYLPIEEAASKLAALAMLQEDIGLVNLCSGRPTSVRSLVEGWLREFGWKIDLEYGALPYAEHEPFAFWGSTRKLDSALARD
ncbi:MAG: hypothetical protein QOJ81_1208, partial [Chloroflexota bacterium]|nr:hypothetical protein [Chloroflexota bacterium]